MSTVGEALQGGLARAGLLGRLRQEAAVGLWPRVAGPQLAQRTRALYVQDGTLWVAVQHPAWAGQLAFLRDALGRRLAEAGAEVRQVRFCTRADARTLPEGEDEHRAPRVRPDLNGDDERVIADLCRSVGDVELARAWRGVVRAGWRRARAVAIGGESS